MRQQPASNAMDQLLAAKRKVSPEISKWIHPSKKVRTLKKHAAAVKPPQVSSLQEIDAYIQENLHETYTVSEDGERLSSIHCQGHNSLILTTRRLLTKLRHATLVQADATYQVVKKNLDAQLFTIHANWDGYVRRIETRGIISVILSRRKFSFFSARVGRDGRMRLHDEADD